MRMVAGCDVAGESVDIRRQAHSDDVRGPAIGDDAVRTDAGRNERGLAARERLDQLRSTLHAYGARERVQTVRRRSREVDRGIARGLEMLEPEVFAIDAAADTGPNALPLDDELLG